MPSSRFPNATAFENLTPGEREECPKSIADPCMAKPPMGPDGRQYLLKIKPGSSPGLAGKVGLWPEVCPVKDQSKKCQKINLVETVVKVLQHADRERKFPSMVPSASERGSLTGTSTRECMELLSKQKEK